MKREDILDAAKAAVSGQREQDYGTPESNFGLIGQLWTTYLNHLVTAEDVSNMMCLLKIARIKTGRAKEDSYIDACGYMACGGEIATADKADEPHDSLENAKKVFYEKFTRRMKEEFQKEYEDKDAALMWEKYELKVLVRKLRDMSDLLYQYANRLKKEEDEDDED